MRFAAAVLRCTILGKSDYGYTKGSAFIEIARTVDSVLPDGSFTR
jgi:hypothetical protein